MQGNESDVHAARANRRKNFRRKVQPCCGRGYRSALLCINRLVAVAVVAGIGAVNIRRQWDVAEPLQCAPEIFAGCEAKHALAEFAALGDLGLQCRVDAGVVASKKPRLRPRRPCVPALPAPATPIRRVARSAELLSRRWAAAGLSERGPVANRRAGITRLLFSTSRSPSFSMEGKSDEHSVANSPLQRSSESMRAPDRSSGGSCAINSSGRSKSKSFTSTKLILEQSHGTFFCVAARCASALCRARSSASCSSSLIGSRSVASRSTGILCIKLTTTREKGFGISSRSHEFTCQVRSGSR